MGLNMDDHIWRDTPALVEETLATYGMWDAVSFLLLSHSLRQSDYETWRMGDAACLQDVITGSKQDALDMLETALRHARSLDLTSAALTWTGWGKQSGKTLRLFYDHQLNAKFQLCFSPRTDRPQLDLFMDAPHTILLNRLRQALLNRSPEYDALLHRAQHEIAEEPALARLGIIRKALLIPSIENPAAWFTHLNETIAPAAREEFSRNHTDIMAPLWRAVAAAMRHISFNPARPDQHSSRALLLARDWEQCLESVAQVPDWFKHPGLHERRIAALSAMREYEAERAAWMLYCWHRPDTAAIALDTALGGANLHRCGLHGVWQQFSQMETEPDTEDFPALIALRFGANTAQSSIFEQATHTPGWRHYRQITELLSSEQHGDADIERRSDLKAGSPWLFQAFMATRH